MITAIFDLDGTLANTIYDLGDAVNYGLEKLGCPTHDYESYKKMVGNGVKKLCERALPEEKRTGRRSSTACSRSIMMCIILTRPCSTTE